VKDRGRKGGERGKKQPLRKSQGKKEKKGGPLEGKKKKEEGKQRPYSFASAFLAKGLKTVVL